MAKTCFKCGERKQLSAFYKHSGMKDGHLNKCKECTKIDNRQSRLNRIDYYRAYDIERSKLPHRKDAEAIRCKNYRNKYPEKYKAHVILNNAVRDGKLTKPNTCSKCGKYVKVQGHHNDYSKPLEVEWLCVACHLHKD